MPSLWVKSITANSRLNFLHHQNVFDIMRAIVLFCTRGDTIQHHGGLRSRELGQAPMLLVFLTPRQALSSHPHLQMVWLYWLQDRDSMPNWYTINHLTILHTHNETQLWNWIQNIFILKSRNLSCWCGWDDNACLGVRNTSSIGAWPNSLDRSLKSDICLF